MRVPVHEGVEADDVDVVEDVLVPVMEEEELVTVLDCEIDDLEV